MIQKFIQYILDEMARGVSSDDLAIQLVTLQKVMNAVPEYYVSDVVNAFLGVNTDAE